jgi:hypothetical protein
MPGSTLPKPDEAAKTSRGSKKSAGKGQPPPVLPSVNILSSWVFERMAVSRLRKRFVLGAVVLLLLVAGLWTVQQLRVGQAEKVLRVEQAETSRLSSQTSELAPVKTFVARVGQQELTVQNNMAGEIYFSRVLEELQGATPLSATIDTLSVALDPNANSVALGTAVAPEDGSAPATIPTETLCPGPDPFNTKVVVGCITLSGTAASRADVGDLVINLGGDGLFVEPFISTTTTADGSGVSFSGSVGLSDKVYSHRYADLDKLLKAER